MTPPVGRAGRRGRRVRGVLPDQQQVAPEVRREGGHPDEDDHEAGGGGRRERPCHRHQQRERGQQEPGLRVEVPVRPDGGQQQQRAVGQQLPRLPVDDAEREEDEARDQDGDDQVPLERGRVVEGFADVPQGAHPAVERRPPPLALDPQPAVHASGPPADPADVARPSQRREQQPEQGPPEPLATEHRDQRGQHHDRDERVGGGPGRAGEQAERPGGEPPAGEQGVERPRGERGEQRLGVGHRLDDGVRHESPDHGQEDARAPAVQVVADREEAPGGRQRGGPGQHDGGAAQPERRQRLHVPHQQGVEREERHVALHLLRVVVPVLGDAQVPAGVGADADKPCERGVPRVAPHGQGDQPDRPDGGVADQGGPGRQHGAPQACGQWGRWCGLIPDRRAVPDTAVPPAAVLDAAVAVRGHVQAGFHCRHSYQSPRGVEPWRG